MTTEPDDDFNAIEWSRKVRRETSKKLEGLIPDEIVKMLRTTTQNDPLFMDIPLLQPVTPPRVQKEEYEEKNAGE